MKPISNFRDHPALKYDEQKSVVKIDTSIYLITQKEVRQITPTSITDTNIGEPYLELVRFSFMDEEEEDSIDISPNDLQDLVNMVNLSVPEKFSRYLDSYEED